MKKPKPERHVHRRQRSGATGSAHSTLPDSSSTAEPTEGEIRLRDLQQVLAGLKPIKDSMEQVVATLATQSQALATQYVLLGQLVQIQQAACNRERFVQAYGRMWS